MWAVLILWTVRGQRRGLLFALLFHYSLWAGVLSHSLVLRVSAGGLHCCSQGTYRLSDTDFTPNPTCKAFVASAAPKLMANANTGHNWWQLATLELCGSPLLQMGKLSHILTSKDMRGIWRSLQEIVGKEASCNYKPSIFSCTLKWKMLVILAVQRSNNVHSCLHREPWPPVPPLPCVPQREGHSRPTAVPGTARPALPLQEAQPEGMKGGKQQQQSPFLSPDQWIRLASSWLIYL